MRRKGERMMAESIICGFAVGALVVLLSILFVRIMDK